jgi:hypothetical protein
MYVSHGQVRLQTIRDNVRSIELEVDKLNQEVQQPAASFIQLFIQT